MAREQQATPNTDERVKGLRSSPIRGIRPVSDQVATIPIEDIELDPTNPGSVTTSRRYQRREKSMLDSFDILDSVVYPIVVCQHPEHPEKYIHIDGAGRMTMLRSRGAKEVSAIVYPPMPLEERICFRQTLNAAQEPFDAVSIIHDLRILASERGLSLQDKGHLKALVRDLPDRVQAKEKDLLLLTEWHPDVVARMGEPTEPDEEVIGLDQLRSLNRLLQAINKQHPTVTDDLGGKQQVSKVLADAFTFRRFAVGMRSQEGIRKATKAAKEQPKDSDYVRRFLQGQIPLAELLDAPTAEDVSDDNTELTESSALIKACQNLTSWLVSVDADALSERERRTLEWTLRVLESVIP